MAFLPPQVWRKIFPLPKRKMIDLGYLDICTGLQSLFLYWYVAFWILLYIVYHLTYFLSNIFLAYLFIYLLDKLLWGGCRPLFRVKIFFSCG